MRAGDSPCKDVILKALTRLNNRSTLRHAAEELSIIVRALDIDSLSALVQSICTTTGAWEPKPVAKKECVRVLAQLPLPSCPVADTALQQLLPKILGYLRKTLQDTDSLVREASSEAMAAYTQGYTKLYGCDVPGSTASPVVKVVFDCLAEQKKEGQMGASQALLKMSPFLGPLDKDLVKLIIKLLKSTSFLGAAQLLTAVASTDAELRTPVGLVKHGSSAFLPYINHLIGQPQQQRRTSAHSNSECVGPSSGGGSTASSIITVSGKPFSASGILGCLASQDWAVRRAAADAIRAVVLLVGPELEPEGCWGLGEPGSVTGRCMNALEECRFDKVKEAREAAREAAALIQQLHRFVAEQGPDGDWLAWARINLPYSGWQPLMPSPPYSPKVPRSPGSFRQVDLQHMSPIAERFRRAAVDSDVIVEPGSITCTLKFEAADEDNVTAADDAEGSEPAAAAAAAEGAAAEVNPVTGAEMLVLDGSVAEAGCKLQQEHSASRVGADLAAEHSCASVSSSTAHQPKAVSRKQPQQVQATQPRKLWSARAPSGSRPGSAQGSRPSSASNTGASNSRSSSAQDASAAIRKQSSAGSLPGPLPSYAAGTHSSSAKGPGAATGGKKAAGAVRQSGCPLPGATRIKAGSSQAQTAGSWQGPSQQEWEQLQHQLAQHQQHVEQLQQQATAAHAQHAAEVQALRETSTAAYVALQERLNVLEVLVQRQQQALGEQQQQQREHTPRQVSSPYLPRSPMRSRSSPSSGAAMTAAAVTAVNSPVGGVLGSRDAALSEGAPSSNRLYKSEEWGFPLCSSGRKSSMLPIDPVGHRSFNSLLTPTSASAGLKCPDTGMATPGDLEAAYADAVRVERGGVHLLRLCQKTGPVWGQLSTYTCQALLEVFIKHVRDGVMLHRVLPWLWRLADEEVRPYEPTRSQQQQLLEALECCPAAEDLQAQEKVCLLFDTLKAVWTVQCSR